jgi:catechol 2,3-dioxygenase-like lactoylglutathione lyase family enzyme
VPVSLSLLVIRCSDLDVSKRFYEALGLALRPEQHQSGPQHWSCQVGETVLELYPTGSSIVAPVRLGFHVIDVKTTVDAALASGGRLSGSFDGARTVVVDPDGNKIELTPLPVTQTAEQGDLDDAGDRFFDDPSWRARLTDAVRAFTTRKRYSSLSADVLSTIADPDLELVLVDFVRSFAEYHDGDLRAALDLLSPNFRAVYATWSLEADVHNGGFNQYFWNTGAAFASDAAAGFHLIGRPDVGDLVLRALELWRDDRDRVAPLQTRGSADAFSESYTGSPLTELDHEFGACSSDLSATRVRFIRKCPQLFVADLPAG